MSSFNYTVEPWCLPAERDIVVSRQVMVQDNLCLSPDKPEIEKIVDVKNSIHINSSTTIKSVPYMKVVINGYIEQTFFVLSDYHCQVAHVLCFRLPFCTFINLPSHFSPSQPVMPQGLIEYFDAELINCREIRECVLLLFWIPCSPCCNPPIHHHTHKCSPKCVTVKAAMKYPFDDEDKT